MFKVLRFFTKHVETDPDIQLSIAQYEHEHFTFFAVQSSDYAKYQTIVLKIYGSLGLLLSCFLSITYIHTMYNNTGTLNLCSNQERWIQKQNKKTLHKSKYVKHSSIILKLM